MIDLNGLKKINDTYGHEKGDISINALCQIVCQTFAILENSDYENREALMQSMSDTFMRNMRDNSMPPWERVTAAIGFAAYNPAKKESVDKVFQRADAAMYKNKRAMKKAFKTDGRGHI